MKVVTQALKSDSVISSVNSSRPLRIAQVTATFPPYPGGTGNVCYHNACELARLGHHVTVFTAALKDAPANEFIEGFQVKRLKPLIRVGNAPLLPSLLGQLRGFDLIHWHYPFFGGELTALAACLYRIPLVITYHQDVFLSGSLALIEKILRPTLSRVALRSARRVLFTSLDYGQASYSRPLLMGRERLIGELPNGVDTARFSPGDFPAELRQQLNLAIGDKVILLVARLDRAHYFKGVEVFLAALAGLESNVKGVIVGEGDLRTGYQQRAQELGLAERVIFAGRVAEAALPDYYRLAQVTVLPSLTMGEAFGLVLVESLASGTPVIASNLPGVRTVVAAPDAGLLVEPGDAAGLAQAIRQILSDETCRQEMGQRGRARVEQNYDWRQIGLRLDTIYREVLLEHNSPFLAREGGQGG